MRFFLSLMLSFIFLSGIAQQEPTHIVDTTGTIYWRKSTPVYLFVSDSPTGENSERLKSERTPQYAERFYLDTEGVNYIRSREAVDPETMRVIPDSEVMFEIYADGIAPITKATFDYQSKYDDKITYYGNKVTISLEATDNLTGVSRLLYSLNGREEKEYSGPIEVDTREAEFEYYAIDKVGNIEEKHTSRFMVDMDMPFSDLTINGITKDSVISLSSKLYLQAYDSTSGIASVFYKFDDSDYRKYGGKELLISNLVEGQHSLTYYSTDNVGNEEKAKTFEFYLDRSAPLMVADVLGDRFIVGDEIYFSGRTKLKLTAVDNKVGVKEIMYTIDDGDFVQYTVPFYLPSVAGIHSIKYYSVDNLNNSTADSKKSRYLGQGGYEEFKHNVNKFYVDLTGPLVEHAILNHSFVRDDTLFIGPQTKIKFSGSDSESGLNKFSYSFKEDIGEQEYSEPFAISNEKDGFYTLEYFGYDNVNNRNVSEFSFYYDATLPEIFIQFNTGSVEGTKIPTYPITSGLFLSATDRTSGIRSLSYSLDGSAFVPYKGLISGFQKGKHEMTIRANDFLNNVQETTIEFKIK
ncbi:MAG: hypothetical protein RIC35_13075 [Marinoscillum sp.]